MKDTLAKLSRNAFMGVMSGVVVTGISNSLTLVSPLTYEEEINTLWDTCRGDNDDCVIWTGLCSSGGVRGLRSNEL